ncbi:hypothetical protein BKA64DRAFT_718796 [Cadophora sp. MPI-SDFR-AT-0126]|nr:hypothetical protein BKA64DRAFT_718796 [Leotiomycetes sp. MPI-SDFR-AT-0126]
MTCPTSRKPSNSYTSILEVTIKIPLPFLAGSTSSNNISASSDVASTSQNSSTTEFPVEIQQSVSSNFSLFSKLPYDIRLIIWELTISEGRTIHLQNGNEQQRRRFREENDERKTTGTINASCSTKTPSANDSSWRTPAILQVNKESRSVGVKCYELALQGQRGGKPIYIDYSRDELCLQGLDTLEVLYGRKIFGDDLQSLANFYGARPHKPDMRQAQNDVEMKLRFLSFATVVTDIKHILTSLITLFRNLEMITCQRVPRVIRDDRFMARYDGWVNMDSNWAYEDTKALEDKLKGLWAKDDEQRGMQCAPNKIPKFNFVGVPRLRDCVPITIDSYRGTSQVFGPPPPVPRVYSGPAGWYPEEFIYA